MFQHGDQRVTDPGAAAVPGHQGIAWYGTFGTLTLNDNVEQLIAGRLCHCVLTDQRSWRYLDSKGVGNSRSLLTTTHILLVRATC